MHVSQQTTHITRPLFSSRIIRAIGVHLDQAGNYATLLALAMTSQSDKDEVEELLVAGRNRWEDPCRTGKNAKRASEAQRALIR